MKFNESADGVWLALKMFNGAQLFDGSKQVVVLDANNACWMRLPSTSLFC